MYSFNHFVNKSLSVVLSPLMALGEFWSLLLLSILMGIFMVWLFGKTSNQKAIKTEKDKIKAHLIEMRLFKDDLPLMMSAFIRILLYNMRYMRCFLKPIIIMTFPLCFLLIHLNNWYGYQALQPGDSAILSVKVSDADKLSNVKIEVEKGLIIETPPLTIAELREINWRIKAEEYGDFLVKVNVGGETYLKTITVSKNQPVNLSSRRVISSFWKTLTNPGEEPFAEDALLDEISLKYAIAEVNFLGWKTHWLLLFMVLSTFAGFAFKGILKVEI